MAQRKIGTTLLDRLDLAEEEAKHRRRLRNLSLAALEECLEHLQANNSSEDDLKGSIAQIRATIDAIRNSDLVRRGDRADVIARLRAVRS